MEKVNAKEMDKRLRKIVSFAKKEGWLKIAAYMGYDETTPVKMWINRKRVPNYQWPRLEKLLTGEAQVEIKIK